jgi:hypothetical protein
MASNTSGVIDPDYNENGDWIELYNAGAKMVDLGGYFLTDNFNDSTKWKIPVGTQIAAKSFLLIWADGYNTGLHTGFKLSADGEEIALFNTEGILIDSVSFGFQEPNISFGKRTSVSQQWVFFTDATPGSANSTSFYEGIVKSEPDFSVSGGIFNEAITLNLRTVYGGEVRYTLDGSEPNAQSSLAGSPISISKNTVVRARILKTAQLPGPVITNSYFIDTNHELTDLPIVSIASNPENFWDPVKGIYVVHDSKPDWEIPINIELFENDGRDKATFNLPAGAKSTGLYSWQLPEKMLGISFRKEYGASKLEYPLIFDKQRKVYDTFSLRASGSDWGNTMFRDGMIQTASVENTSIDESGFRACVVFINGEYMGVHNIREKIDEDYVVGNHGLEPETFDMIEETDQGHYAETGDFEANNFFLSLLSKDLTDQANYNALANEMDIEEFTEMVCTEVYSGNSSIGHNLMKWKPKDSGKWKWILMDLDRGFNSVNGQLINFYLNESDWPFKQLMKNADYKKKFGLKLSDLLFTTFNPDRMVARIEKHKKTIEAEMPKHIARWKGTKGTGNYSNISAISSMDYWLTEVEDLKTYAVARPNVVLTDLTNYGFQEPIDITIASTPANSGTLTFNGLKIPVDVCNGGYPSGETVKLTAEAKAGYKFIGWSGMNDTVFIAKEQDWKYNDSGVDLGTEWCKSTFSDTAWKTGKAELGYGDDDENTVIDYGSSSSNKYITSYFRKNFILKDKQKVASLKLQLKCDDGAVVYLNGIEVQRFNLPSGSVGFETLASTSISGSDEDTYLSFSIGTDFLVSGKNSIAVEVHQNSKSSSDASFDLELTAEMSGSSQFLSKNKEYSFTTQSATKIFAVFESDGKCILPEEITEAVTLNKACSPYVTSRDVTISSKGKLIIEPGVEIWLSDGASIYSSGIIEAKGTKVSPIVFKGNPERANKNWGFISLNNVSDTSRFVNVIVEDASRGKLPREVAAITAFKSTVKFDSIFFDNILANPIATRYCDIRVTNSQFHSNIIGDMVNVTRGKGYIANCDFVGNYLPDNDAIDFNGGKDGVVKDCVIREFYGINNDAIDLGEDATNIKIEGLYIHDITDKGVSVGQRATVHISNSLFTNCNLGVGVKDSSNAVIDHCTFYGTGTPVATYEKILGRAGGNVKVTNSILSNSYVASYLCDKYSTIDISYSTSDNDRLPNGKHNLFVNPLFNNPTNFDFSLKTTSPCLKTANDGRNIGSGLTDTGIEPEILISGIAYLTDPLTESIEFIELYNPGNTRVDLTGYKFASGVLFAFPSGTTIAPKETYYITSNAATAFWDGRGATVFQWESGKLADEGEDIQLVNEVNTMIDEVEYNNKAPWPLLTNSNQALSLIRQDVDNHFAEYWTIKTIDELVAFDRLAGMDTITVYPNPSSGIFSLNGAYLNGKPIAVYDVTGLKVASFAPSSKSTTTLNLEHLNKGIYLLRVGDLSKRLMITK